MQERSGTADHAAGVNPQPQSDDRVARVGEQHPLSYNLPPAPAIRSIDAPERSRIVAPLYNAMLMVALTVCNRSHPDEIGIIETRDGVFEVSERSLGQAFTNKAVLGTVLLHLEEEDCELTGAIEAIPSSPEDPRSRRFCDELLKAYR